MSKAVCVFCGAATPTRNSLGEAIDAFADGLLARQWGLVYGGGRVGLMGRVADRVMAGDGSVLGVIPHQLVSREQAHRGLTELIQVDTMHERKALMYDRSDAFVAFPGGFGTLDEIMEIATWKQLSIHTRPVIFANIDGYYSDLERWMVRAEADGLLRPEVRAKIAVLDTVAEIFAHLETDPAALRAPMNWA